MYNAINKILRALVVTVLATLGIPAATQAQYGGCGNEIPGGMVILNEQPQDDPQSVTHMVAVGTPFEISHANRVVITSMLATHICVYISPSIAPPPPEFVRVIIAQGDYIDQVVGDREPGSTILYDEQNVQITAPNGGGYQLIELNPPVQIGGVIWLILRFPHHDRKFVQATGPVAPPNAGVSSLAFSAIHNGVPPAGGDRPIVGGEWTDYNDIPEIGWFGHRPAIRAVELVVASGACCDPSFPLGCLDSVVEQDCTNLGGTFLGNAVSCLGQDNDGDGMDDACNLTACCMPTAACQLMDAASCAASGGTNMPGVNSCLSGMCFGACCDPSGGCLDFTAELGCNAGGGTYAGPSTVCLGDNDGDGADDVCPANPTIGACCEPCGCSDTDQATCNANGGSFHGPGTDCASVGCLSSLPGACCLPTGGCISVNSSCCAAQGGTFQVGGTTCASAPCGPIGACCDGGCTDNVDQATCQSTGGTYQGDGTDCATSPCPNQCPADLNGDLGINAADLAIVLGSWGPCPLPCTPGQLGTTCLGDLDGDCDVNAMDLAIVLGCWGSACPCP